MTEKTNRLAAEKSPYLRQHAGNPVDWYPWGDEAFEKAHSEGKPIFLSVGYSTCHWCHVMEKESFENEEIAALLNAHFVAVKVDREERPDVDRIYMSALQAMGQDGGWPMSMFLLPDLKPFWGGTYFPPAARYGRAGFPEILRRIHDVWSSERGKAEQAGESIVAYLNDLSRSGASGERAGAASVDLCFEQLEKTFDPDHGGFGNGPKFPRPPALQFLIGYAARSGSAKAREMIETTLDRMAAGGVYDHVGGGFHRYAVDREWRVPHFEKMLYDQAQLITCYSDAYRLTGKQQYARIVRETAGYVLRDMTGPGGGFFSAEDADSPRPDMPGESGEGAFYLWTKGEIDSMLGPDAIPFSVCYGVEAEGNAPFDPQEEFAGRNILYALQTPQSAAGALGMSADQVDAALERGRRVLLERRKGRTRPHLDDKVLTSWNGLMISALAKAAGGIGEPSFLASAEGAAEFVFENLYDAVTGTLKRRFREGEARFDAYLEDYAFFVQGLLDLYESTGNSRWLQKAVRLTEKQIELFWDTDHGAFFSTTGRDASILVRIKDHYDGAEPTGNSVSAMNLLRCAQMLDRPEWRRKADRIFDVFAPTLAHQPVALPGMAAAFASSHAMPAQVVLAGERSDQHLGILRQKVFERLHPDLVVLTVDGPDDYLPSHVPAVRGMAPVSGRPAAYVCRDFVCKLPTSDPDELSRFLEGL